MWRKKDRRCSVCGADDVVAFEAERRGDSGEMCVVHGMSVTCGRPQNLDLDDFAACWSVLAAG